MPRRWWVKGLMLAILAPLSLEGQTNPNARKRFEPAGVAAVAFSPDLKLLVSGSFDETLTLWDAGTGKAKFRVKAHPGGVFAVAFSPDGQRILSGGLDKQIRLWDTAGKEVGKLEGHEGEVTCLLFSADGKVLLSGSTDKTIRSWNLATRKQVGKIIAHASGVYTLSLTGDNLLVSTGEMSKILAGGHVHYTGPDMPRLWNLATAKEVRAYDVEADRAVVSFDRRYLAYTGIETIDKPGVVMQKRVFVLRDAATGQALTELQGPGDGLSFSPDGKTLAGVGQYGGLCLFEAATGQVVYRHKEWSGTVLAFSADGKRLACPRTTRGAPKAMPKGDDEKSGKEAAIQFLDLPPQQEKWTKKAMTAEPAKLWEELRGDNGAAAYEAIWTLAAMPDKTVALLKDKIKAPAPASNLAKIRQLIGELDSDQFAVRKTAEGQLRKLGFEAELPLRQALDAGTLTLEARRRTQTLLAALKLPFPLKGDLLREGRALQTLEIIGTPAALALIRTFAEGPATSPLAQDSKRILERWEKVQGK